jgi:hypothetical protein
VIIAMDIATGLLALLVLKPMRRARQAPILTPSLAAGG